MFIHLPMKELQVLKLQVKSLFGDCVVDVKFLFHSGVLLKLTFTFLCISLNMLLFITPYRSSWLGNIFDVVWDVIGVGVDVDVSSCARMSNEPKPRDLFDCTSGDVGVLIYFGSFLTISHMFSYTQTWPILTWYCSITTLKKIEIFRTTLFLRRKFVVYRIKLGPLPINCSPLDTKHIVVAICPLFLQNLCEIFQAQLPKNQLSSNHFQ